MRALNLLKELMHLRRASRWLVVPAAATALVLATAGAAAADQTPGRAGNPASQAAISTSTGLATSISDVSHMQANMVGSGSQHWQAAQAVTITCTLTANDPHQSTTPPFQEYVDAHSTVSCTSPVASINTSLVLYLDAYPVSVVSNGNRGVRSLTTTVNTTCVDGFYEATPNTTIVFPPGFVPHTSTLSATSNLVGIVC
jgi:hypothetical protein